MISTLIKTQTASGSAYLDFIDGTSDVVFDNTYDEYMFVCTDIGPATDGEMFCFQVNATDDAGGDYDSSPITSTFFNAQHDEADSNTDLAVWAASDLAQGTAFQHLTRNVGNGSDESAAGILHIFNPSNTTYAKNFHSRFSSYYHANYSMDNYVAGYINDTTAIDEIRFKMTSGNFDGVIQMYGIS